jgi:hypothetical protein
MSWDKILAHVLAEAYLNSVRWTNQETFDLQNLYFSLRVYSGKHTEYYNGRFNHD